MNPETDAPISPEQLLAEQPIRRITRDGTEFVLLGTAHVSRRSADAVSAMLARESFDAVAVELCPHRAEALRNPDAIASLNLFQVLKEGKAGLIAAGLALGAFQRRLADQYGIEPGAEMRRALSEAQTRNLPVWLVDRDVGLTLRRARAALGFWAKAEMSAGLVASLISTDEIAEEEVEKLKQGDMLQSTFAEFAKQSAPLYRAMIEERDQYMAARLREEAASAGRPHKVLVVIGAGHLAGSASQLESATQSPAELLAPVTAEPKPGQIGKWIGMGITLLVLVGFVLAFMHSASLGMELLVQWVLILGTGGALGASLALAHPISILTAFIVSPLTPFHPALASGMFSGATELWLRKPIIGDFHALRDDVRELRGWWRNRVSRVFVTFFLTNLGTALAFYIATVRLGTAFLPD
ncbi:MAG: TraB/GumN family protein [Ahniella sp.]|nr:TraB/GumN family protein [Ahniella sp.]